MAPDFDERYMQKRLYIAWRAENIAKAIKKVLKPKSVYDFGCATGDIAKGLLDLGIDTIGIDSSDFAGSLLPPGNFLKSSIQDFICPERRDLGILLEVLSITPCIDRALILNTVVHSIDNYIIINRLKTYEHAILNGFGFQLNPDKTEKLKKALQPFSKEQAFKALYNTGEVWQQNIAYGKPSDEE